MNPKDLAEVNALRKIKELEHVPTLDDCKRTIFYNNALEIINQYLVELNPTRDYIDLQLPQPLNIEEFKLEMKIKPNNEIIKGWIHNRTETLKVLKDKSDIIKRMLYYAATENTVNALANDLIYTIKYAEKLQHEIEYFENILKI